MNQTTSNIFGGLSVLISLFLWSFALFANTYDLLGRFQHSPIVLGLSALAAPIIAAWYGSKWWLLMLLSPVMLYFFFAPVFHL